MEDRNNEARAQAAPCIREHQGSNPRISTESLLIDERPMAVSADRARELALALPTATEAPHWHRLAFRTPRKMFATLDAQARDLNFMFNQDFRDFYCEQAPGAFRPVPGGWGRNGCTRCDLDAVDETTLVSALKAAHELAAAKPAKARKAIKARLDL